MSEIALGVDIVSGHVNKCIVPPSCTVTSNVHYVDWIVGLSRILSHYSTGHLFWCIYSYSDMRTIIRKFPVLVSKTLVVLICSGMLNGM